MVFANTTPRQVSISTLTQLSPTDRVLWQILEDWTLPHHFENWHSNERLAKLARCSVRTVQAFIKKLVSFGLIDVVKDAAMRTGRRLRLLWRIKPLPPPTEVVHVESLGNDRHRVRTIPDPSPRPAPADGVQPTPPPRTPESDEGSSEGTPKRRATPAEVAEVVKLAQTSVKHPPTRKVIIETAKEYRLSWVRAALDEVKGKAKYWGLIRERCQVYRELGQAPATEKENAAERRRKRLEFAEARWGTSGAVPESRGDRRVCDG